MDDTSGIEHQPREGAEANVCGFSTVYFVSKALDGILELAATRKYSDLASLASALAAKLEGIQSEATEYAPYRRRCVAELVTLCEEYSRHVAQRTAEGGDDIAAANGKRKRTDLSDWHADEEDPADWHSDEEEPFLGQMAPSARWRRDAGRLAG